MMNITSYSLKRHKRHSSTPRIRLLTQTSPFAVNRLLRTLFARWAVAIKVTGEEEWNTHLQGS